jgi:hypothetical protein
MMAPQPAESGKISHKSNMSSAFNYVVTAHRPSVVTHSATANFTAADEHNLVLAKNTRLEIHLLTPDGLRPLFDFGVFGRIASLEIFRPRVCARAQITLICLFFSHSPF